MVEKNQSRGPSPGQRNPSRGPSRGPQSRLSTSEGEAYSLPIKKTNPLVYVGAGVVVLGLAGAALFTSGSDKSSAPVEPEAKAGSQAPLTKEQQKERLEHLRMTQAALEAAAAEEKTAGGAAKSPAASPATEDAPKSAAPSTSKQAIASKAEAPKAEAPKSEAPKKNVSNEQAKKKAADLDALGADITSALK